MNRQGIFIGFITMVALTVGACAHDPDPFAREKSLEEQKQDERQALQQSEHAMQRQRLEAARASSENDGERAEGQNRQQADSSEGDVATQAEDQEAVRSAREAASAAATSVRQMQLPRTPVSRIITVPRLGR